MKCLIVCGLILAGCTNIAEQRARAISADSEKCSELHGDGTDTLEYSECMEKLAAESQKKQRIEEARRAAQNAGRTALPPMQIYRTF